MTPAAVAIEKLISYSISDWAVTDAEEIAILALIRTDTTPDQTVADLKTASLLDPLFSRVTSNRRQLVELLGGRISPGTAAGARPVVARLDPEMAWAFTISNELQNNLRALRMTSRPSCSGVGPVRVSGPSNAPFTGAGATGTNPATLSVPAIDKGLLWFHHDETRRRYSNPIPGSLPAYLSKLTASDRLVQAQTLVCQEIVSCVPASYAGGIPSRSDVLDLASGLYKLDPSTLAAFILAEQRDQSRNEDAKDLTAATSITKGNTSIGLGQVVVSTARNGSLFSDLLSSAVHAALSHAQIARLLASDEFNIFAVAKYIRHVADKASTLNLAALPRTRATYPAINMRAYAGHSSAWPADNLRALGSEYTSAPWDDKLVPAWGEFVHQAQQDIRGSKVFK